MAETTSLNLLSEAITSSINLFVTIMAKSTGGYRSRARGGFTTSGAFYRSYSNVTGSWYRDGFSVGNLESMTDFVTPNFHEKIAAGHIVMSPMVRTTQLKLAQALSNAKGRYNGNPSYWWEYVTGPRTIWTMGLGPNTSILPGTYSVHSGTDLDNLQVEASTKCLSQVGRASTSMWENLAETDKTVSMLWGPLGYFFQRESAMTQKEKELLRRGARKRNLPLEEALRRFGKKALLGAEGVANLWLMYRYGVMPLVKSIKDVNEALKAQVQDDRNSTRGSATSSANSWSESTYSNSGYSWKIRKTTTETISARAVSIDELVRNWSYNYGFSKKELITLPWELIPYSFVADWFVNAGDYFGALANCFEPRSLGQCLTTTVVRTAVWQNISMLSSPSGEGCYSPQLDLVREDAVNKWRDLGLRSPGLVIKADFRLDNVKRVADSVALAGQLITRRFRGLL